MIMNNGQNSRTYSSVPQNAPRAQEQDLKSKLKELVKDQLEHELLSSLTLAEYSDSYCKMGLDGHQHKMRHKAVEEFKENFDWRKYYYHVFEEVPCIEIQYKTSEIPKSLDDLHTKLYEMHTRNEERLNEVLNLAQQLCIYTDMDLLLEMYKKCEKHGEKLERKLKQAQTFGYDVSHILAKDAELKKKYRCLE